MATTPRGQRLLRAKESQEKGLQPLPVNNDVPLTSELSREDLLALFKKILIPISGDQVTSHGQAAGQQIHTVVQEPVRSTEVLLKFFTLANR